MKNKPRRRINNPPLRTTEKKAKHTIPGHSTTSDTRIPQEVRESQESSSEHDRHKKRAGHA